MVLIKLATRNIKAKISDELIYLFSLTAFSALMLSAFMPEVFPLPGGVGDVLVANSLPPVIALSLFCFLVYANRFMLKRRSQELAVYRLSGIPKNTISLLFFMEHSLLGVMALVLGLLLGLLFVGAIRVALPAAWEFDKIIAAVLKACCYFLAAHFSSLGITVLFLRRLEIKNLIYQRKYNEKQKTAFSRLLLYSITAVLFYALFIVFLGSAAAQTAFTITPIIAVVLYCFYKALFGWAEWRRGKKSGLIYKNRRLVAAGQALSKTHTDVRMCAVISACILVALCSAAAGYVFMADGGILPAKQLNTAMGFTQIYISVVFTIIVFSVMALRQVIENREYKENYVVLRRLGTGKKVLRHMLLQQIIISFSLPVLAVLPVAAGGLLSLAHTFGAAFRGGHLIARGALLYFGVFLILYIGFIAITYKSLKKNIGG